MPKTVTPPQQKKLAAMLVEQREKAGLRQDDVLRGFLVQQRRKAGALVARNIRRLRVARGLSQEMLAVDAGIDRTYVSRLERGLENPTVAVLEKLARAVSSNIEELFRVPRAGETAPRPLKGGRRAKQKKTPVL
jgi:DNA-binding XRE family transcriptional regulator